MSNVPTDSSPSGKRVINSIVDDLGSERDGLNVVERHSKATIRKPTERHSKATVKPATKKPAKKGPADDGSKSR